MTVEEIRALAHQISLDVFEAQGPRIVVLTYGEEIARRAFIAGLEAAQREMVNVLADEWEPVVRSNLAPYLAAAKEAAK